MLEPNKLCAVKGCRVGCESRHARSALCRDCTATASAFCSSTRVALPTSSVAHSAATAHPSAACCFCASRPATRTDAKVVSFAYTRLFTLRPGLRIYHRLRIFALIVVYYFNRQLKRSSIQCLKFQHTAFRSTAG